MEIRRDMARVLFNVLRDTFESGSQTSSALSRALASNKDWSDRKRALFSNTTYDIVRNWRFLWTSLGREPAMEDSHLWHIMGTYMIMNEEEIPSYPEFRGLRPEKVKGRMEKVRKYRAVRESIPDWLDSLGERELDEDWESILHSLNTYPELAIRTNTLKTKRPELRRILKEEGIETRTVEIAPDALVFQKKCNVFGLKAFHDGLFEVQDPASQMVSLLLQVKEGMQVADTCAGQGGKTLHLSALMKNKGRILAMDDTEWKLRELKKRAARAGAQNIDARHVTGTKSYKRMKGKFDRLLLDVPCSGLGSLRRNPDIKWSLDQEGLRRLRMLQRNIMSDYCPLLRPGGKMVYATCSVLPSEGEEQVQWLIDSSRMDLVLEEERRTRPDREGFDGFYMARLLLLD
ncbi:MAG: RsmB/NOP family class I SAM-dependent RNA methyltransferase [Thermoplasmatota archaeon]